MFKHLLNNAKTWSFAMATVLVMMLGMSAFAQSTTSTISGNVNDGKEAIAEAVVTAVHMPTNTAFYAVTNQKGNYVINNVIAGGPYNIKVEKMGFRPTMVQNIYAPIAESVVANIVAEKSAVQLKEVAIYGESDGSGMNVQRSGVGTRIDNHAMEAVPSVDRSLNDVMKLTPQAAVVNGGFSVGGGNYRGSSVAVDGAMFNNTFGIGTNLPAGGAPISLDAIDQIGINITPFNVRQSGFQGGAINMVTKRGTNKWHGSVYDYFTCNDMQGNKVDTNLLTTSSTLNNVVGLTLGGPIVKDKLFFFVNGEYIVDNQAGSTIQARTDEGQEFGGSTGYNRPTVSQMDAISNFLQDQFGYNPGRYQNYSLSTPDYKVMARIDWNINKNNIFNIRFSHTHTANSNNASSSMSPLGGTNTTFNINGENYTVNRYSAGRQSEYAMPFESARYFQEMNFTSIAAELNSRVLDGKGNNMARLTWSYQNEPRSFVGDLFPTVDIMEPYIDANGNRQYGMYTTFGPDPFTYANLRRVNTITATDEFTYTKGIHNILAGAQFEWNRIVNGFMQGGAGWFIYDSWDSFVADATHADGATGPAAFMITHANSNDPTETLYPTFDYSQASIYAQDEIEFSKFFKLTFGLRLEMPIITFPNNNFNADFDTVAQANPESSFAGLSTADLPKLTVNPSPRIGFNWDITKNRKVVLRGGTGLFTGRIPNVWLVSAAGNSNCLQYQYIANLSTGLPVVHFNQDRADIINSVYEGNAFVQRDLAAPTSATIIAKDLKMPTSWKSSLALDIKIPGDIKATIEGIYSYNYNEVYASVLGYAEDGTIELPGENGSRTHYVSENIRNHDEHGNENAKMNGYYLHNVKGKGLHGQYFSIAAQLQKSFKFGLDLMAAYTYSYSMSLSDASGDQVSSFASTPNVNGANAPELGYSSFVAPHRVIGAIGYTINEGKRTATKLGLFYEGMNMGIFSGYLYTRNSYLMNDVTGSNSTLLVYIPTVEELASMPFISDENRAEFESFISNDSYLSKHRGEYSKRNCAKAPWLNRINFKISQEIYFNVNGQRHTLDVGVDFNNIANMFCSKWSVYKSLDSDVILNYNNGTYTFTAPTWSTYNNLSSTWQVRVHLKYAF